MRSQSSSRRDGGSIWGAAILAALSPVAVALSPVAAKAMILNYSLRFMRHAHHIPAETEPDPIE